MFWVSICRHLLEQPSSHVAYVHCSDGCNALGQLASIVLAVVVSIYHRGWMGENHFTTVPTALCGVVLLLAAIAYLLLQQVIIRGQGQESILKKAVGRNWKGKLSPLLYVLEIVASLYFAWLAQVIFAIAALIWLIPDRRIEKRLAT